MSFGANCIEHDFPTFPGFGPSDNPLMARARRRQASKLIIAGAAALIGGVVLYAAVVDAAPRLAIVESVNVKTTPAVPTIAAPIVAQAPAGSARHVRIIPLWKAPNDSAAR